MVSFQLCQQVRWGGHKHGHWLPGAQPGHSQKTNRSSKQGYYKEYNEDGTLWRKHQYRNNKAEGRQLEYYTTDGKTWVEYDMMVHNALLNGSYIK